MGGAPVVADFQGDRVAAALAAAAAGQQRGGPELRQEPTEATFFMFMFVLLLIISFLTKFFNASRCAERLNTGLFDLLPVEEDDHLLHVLRGVDDVLKDLLHLVEGDIVAYHAVQLELMAGEALDGGLELVAGYPRVPMMDSSRVLIMAWVMPSWAVQKPMGTMVAPLAGMPISSRVVREPG